MNNTNPFVPQGSLLEQKNKKRARVKVAVFSIFALNILVLTPLLIQGCSRNKDADQTGTQPADTSSTAATTPDSNQPPPLPDVASNTAPNNTTGSNATVSTPVPPQEPTPAPTPVPPAAPETHEYVITHGDTYYSIAKKYGIKMSDIKAANPNVNPAKLKVGQKIELPSGSSASGTGAVATADSGDVYVVKSGDSLTKIARANGTTVKAIKAENNLKSDHIKAGEKLKLPAKAVAAPADTTAATSPAPSPAPAPAVSPTATASNGSQH